VGCGSRAAAHLGVPNSEGLVGGSSSSRIESNAARQFRHFSRVHSPVTVVGASWHGRFARGTPNTIVWRRTLPAVVETPPAYPPGTALVVTPAKSSVHGEHASAPVAPVTLSVVQGYPPPQQSLPSMAHCAATRCGFSTDRRRLPAAVTSSEVPGLGATEESVLASPSFPSFTSTTLLPPRRRLGRSAEPQLRPSPSLLTLGSIRCDRLLKSRPSPHSVSNASLTPPPLAFTGRRAALQPPPSSHLRPWNSTCGQFCALPQAIELRSTATSAVVLPTPQPSCRATKRSASRSIRTASSAIRPLRLPKPVRPLRWPPTTMPVRLPIVSRAVL
jgi:hypothetical protein